MLSVPANARMANESYAHLFDEQDESAASK